MKVDLLIIDPQVDFCDPAGALPVGGADTAMDPSSLAPIASLQLLQPGVR